MPGMVRWVYPIAPWVDNFYKNSIIFSWILESISTGGSFPLAGMSQTLTVTCKTSVLNTLSGIKKAMQIMRLGQKGYI
jgi:hypothetical protein